MNLWFSPRLKVYVKATLVLLLMAVTFRLAFTIWFYPQGGELAMEELLKGLYLGTKFDLRVVLALLLPFYTLSMIPPLRIFEKDFLGNGFWKSYLTGVFLFLLIFYFADWACYAYIRTRLNASLLRFLHNAHTSAKMVWQTYPVLWMTSGALLLSFCWWKYLGSLFKAPLNEITNAKLMPLGQGKRRTITMVSFMVLVLAMIWGKLARYPLRWSEAFFTQRPFVAAISTNPVHYFFNTYRFRKSAFDKEKVREHYQQVTEYLRFEPTKAQRKALRFDRLEYPSRHPLVQERPNVVVIVLESLAAFKTGLFGNPLNPTPALDQLAKKSVLFKNFYVPTQATARSIFSMLTGVPDVTQIKSSSRNPFAVRQHLVFSHLDDYKKQYFIGGSANWGQIRGVLTHNLEQVEIFEEGSYRSQATDVWGLSDYHLFKEANGLLAQNQGPFLAIIQSASFHRPYSIPQDRGEFQLKEVAQKELKKYGFISQKEYNSLRFQDYALGNFFKLAAKEKYFSNTLFFILGDHGLPHEGATHLKESQRAHNLTNFHVPLLLYAPNIFPAHQYDFFMSQLDLFPTIMGLLGRSYINNSLGRDVFKAQVPAPREVFNFFWYTRPVEYGVLSREWYYLGNNDQKSFLYSLQNQVKPWTDYQRDEGEEFKRLQGLAQGLFHSAQYLLYHNQVPEEARRRFTGRDQTKDSQQ